MRAILLTLLLAGAAAPWQGALRPATISGQVVDATTNAPIAGADVALAGLQYDVRHAVSNEEGRFAFTGVNADSYDLLASHDGYLSGAYGQSEPLGARFRLDLAGADEHVTVQLKLWKLAELSGELKDDEGRPLGNTSVRALPWTSDGGGLRVFDGAVVDRTTTATTDAQGAFRFAELRPGTYTLLVPSVMVFYPGTPSPSAAMRLTLAAGEARHDVDLTLPRVRLATVAGAVSTMTEGHTTNVALHLVEGGDHGFDFTVKSTRAAPDGAFELHDVPPGSYRLRVIDLPTPEPFWLMLGGASYLMPRRPLDPNPAPPRPGESVRWSETSIAIDVDQDVRNLTLPLLPGSRLAGRVVFEGTTPRPSRESGALDLMMVFGVDGAGVASPLSGLGPDGDFSTVGMPPGKYQVVQMGRISAEGWSLQSIRLGGREIYGEAIDLGAGDVAGLEVTFTDRPASLSGVVRNDRAELEAGSSVLIFPSEKRGWVDAGPRPIRIREARTARDGSYRIPGMPPGNYLVAALPGSPPADWQTPASLTSLSALATPVRIRAGEDQQQTLRSRPWR